MDVHPLGVLVARFSSLISHRFRYAIHYVGSYRVFSFQANSSLFRLLQDRSSKTVSGEDVGSVVTPCCHPCCCVIYRRAPGEGSAPSFRHIGLTHYNLLVRNGSDWAFVCPYDHSRLFAPPRYIWYS